MEADDRSSNSCVATRKTEETESTPLCCLCYLLFKSSCICHWHNRQIPWLVWGNLDLPLRGLAILWSLVVVLLGVSFVELTLPLTRE